MSQSPWKSLSPFLSLFTGTYSGGYKNKMSWWANDFILWADKLSCHNHVILMEVSLHKGIFEQICHRCYTPKIDLFPTRFNKKLPLFMSPVPGKKAWAVDALSISRENMDGYDFPSTSLIANVINKILRHDYRWIIVITLGCPNMSLFWDMVNLKIQIPLCLPCQPNLLTQPFNRSQHRDLPNLNLHAWLLEPRVQGFSGQVAERIEAPQRC